MWIEGEHTVGIDVGNNPIRMARNTELQLEATGQIAIAYANGRIEFRNGSRVVAWIAVNASASGGRLN